MGTGHERATEVHGLVEHLFRHEAGRLTASLVRLLGGMRIEQAEEIVQDTLLAALRTWPFQGVPENPSAWLARVARNRALDLLRHDRRRRATTEPDADGTLLDGLAAAPAADLPADGIEDDQLRLVFACCHPALAPEDQVALTLRLLCGLSAEEIASAFLVPVETMRKRLYRAREALRAPGVPFEVPAGSELEPRLEAVLATLYLLFNEGYNASHSSQPIRRDLCLEALRLALLVRDDPRLARPEVDALIALMCLQAARFPARTDDDGALLLLAEQDRSRWSRELIARGLAHLDASARGSELTHYHIEAGIAACHARARQFGDTDWGRILELYDTLDELRRSPVVRLNRAIATGQALGAGAALAALEPLRAEATLSRYYLLHAACGEFLRRSGRIDEAAAAFETALELSGSEAERRLLRSKLAACLTGSERSDA